MIEKKTLSREWKRFSFTSNIDIAVEKFNIQISHTPDDNGVVEKGGSFTLKPGLYYLRSIEPSTNITITDIFTIGLDVNGGGGGNAGPATPPIIQNDVNVDMSAFKPTINNTVDMTTFKPVVNAPVSVDMTAFKPVINNQIDMANFRPTINNQIDMSAFKPVIQNNVPVPQVQVDNQIDMTGFKPVFQVPNAPNPTIQNDVNVDFSTMPAPVFQVPNAPSPTIQNDIQVPPAQPVINVAPTPINVTNQVATPSVTVTPSTATIQNDVNVDMTTFKPVFQVPNAPAATIQNDVNVDFSTMPPPTFQVPQAPAPTIQNDVNVDMSQFNPTFNVPQAPNPTIQNDVNVDMSQFQPVINNQVATPSVTNQIDISAAVQNAIRDVSVVRLAPGVAPSPQNIPAGMFGIQVIG